MQTRNEGTIREMLGEAYAQKQQIDEMKRQIMTLEENMRMAREGVERIRRCGRGASEGQTALRRIADDFEVQRDALCVRMNRLLDRQGLLSSLMKALPDEEYRVLNMKWIERRTWQYIARRVFLCERQCQRLQTNAIREMARELDRREKEESGDALRAEEYS